jgi:hypothetical protein
MLTQIKLVCILSVTTTTAGAAASLELLTQFDRRPSTVVVGAMAREMDALYRDIPVSIGWHDLSGYHSRVVAPRIVFIYFKGDCRAPRLPPHQFVEGLALAGINRVDGRMLPVVTVDCDRTANYIWSSMNGAERANGDTAFGRALARVLAHELYHYFTGATKHTRSALFRASIPASSLLARELRFIPEEVADLEHALAPSTLTAGATRTGDAENGGPYSNFLTPITQTNSQPPLPVSVRISELRHMPLSANLISIR